MPAADDLPALRLLGVRIHTLETAGAVAFMQRVITQGSRAVVANANVHAMNYAHRLPWFRDFLNRSELVFCDGYGVAWAAGFLGLPTPPRYTPPDWIDEIAAMACATGSSAYFLGARPGVAQRAAERLLERWPRLRVAGSHHGYFDKAPASAENRAVLDEINRAQPTILLVGFGMPMQEQWIAENWPAIDARIAMPVGALFDYLAGEVRRPPRWMTDHGLEWLGRMLIEPGRLGRRYLLGNTEFVLRVLRARLASG